MGADDLVVCHVNPELAHFIHIWIADFPALKQPQTHWLRSSGFEPWCSYFYFNSHDLLLCQVRRLNLPWRHIEIFVPTILQLLICYWAMHMGLLNRVRYEVSILSINTQENIDFPKLIAIWICNVWYYVLRRGINFIQICTIYLIYLYLWMQLQAKLDLCVWGDDDDVEFVIYRPIYECQH